jgi:multimeric flavodoxin WrbA
VRAVTPPIAVVTFYSRGGTTERLATVAAVGAVQMRAGIRMRRVADPDPAAALAQFPEHREELRRMHKQYIAPREADLVAADVLVVASTADVGPASPEWQSYFDLLRRLHAEGKLRQKVAVVVDNGPSARAFSSELERLGLSIATAPTESDELARAMALGRAAVTAALSSRSLKESL